MFKLLDRNGKEYLSDAPGTLGGYRPKRIYGTLGCPSALRALRRGGYAKNRVFFPDEATAIAAGYRPCAVCCPDQYRAWKSSRPGPVRSSAEP